MCVLYQVISRLGGDSCTTLEFLNVANIHVMRESFISLMAACHETMDDNFLNQLHDSRWLHHVSTILKGRVDYLFHSELTLSEGY